MSVKLIWITFNWNEECVWRIQHNGLVYLLRSDAVITCASVCSGDIQNIFVWFNGLAPENVAMYLLPDSLKSNCVDFGVRSRYLRQGLAIAFHSIIWDAIAYPCLKYLFLAPKSSYMPQYVVDEWWPFRSYFFGIHILQDVQTEYSCTWCWHTFKTLRHISNRI